jgi:Asp-tRNA(Asn)/Glu-tRNA(Gln) amidotransferase A subunit family amidase
MARTVLDAAHLLDALVGFDPKDVLSSTNVLAPRPEGGYASALSKHSQLRGLRFGVLTQCFGDESEAEGSASNATARAALSKLQDAGIELVEVSVEQLWEQVAFTSLYVQEGRQSLERFFASRPALGFTDVASLHVDPAVELLKLLQTKAPALASEDKKFGERLRAKELFQRRMLSLYAQEKLDAFIYPSAKTPAPLRSDIESGRYAFDGIPTNTVIASQLCWPAITLPAGLTSSDGQLGGLPVGLELMTPPYSDARLLSLAHGVEQAIQARVPPPGLD